MSVNNRTSDLVAQDGRETNDERQWTADRHRPQGERAVEADLLAERISQLNTFGYHVSWAPELPHGAVHLVRKSQVVVLDSSVAQQRLAVGLDEVIRRLTL